MTQTAAASLTSTVDNDDLNDLLAAVILPDALADEVPLAQVFFPQGKILDGGVVLRIHLPSMRKMKIKFCMLCYVLNMNMRRLPSAEAR